MDVDGKVGAKAKLTSSASAVKPAGLPPLLMTDGPNAAMLTFVNARRAVAGKPPVNLSGAALQAEFRTQRALDFYLTGQRLGDLRRYKEAGTDLFPTGKFPVGAESYGSMHCFIVPQSQK